MSKQLDFEEIKTKTIIALFSDDYLMERLVLKGGNAMNIVYKMYNRASLDFDFSIEEDFSDDELKEVGHRILLALESTFKEYNLVVLDYSFECRPKCKREGDALVFWGGYVASFKLVTHDDHQQYKGRKDSLRKRALRIDKGGKQNIVIEISKYEYCEKTEQELDDFIVYVYPPELLALEKIRAVCQQTEEFAEIVGKPGIKGRARDFFDIYHLCVTFEIDLASNDNLEKLTKVFEAKKVPLTTLARLEKYKSYHEATFPSVVDTVSGKTKVLTFDFYFKFVQEVAQKLSKRLGVK